MSKKSKKQARNIHQTSTPTITSRPVITREDEAFNPDYSYVKKDLKRIGALAGTFLAILLVLSFILR